MAVLLMRLIGPLQSWGTQSRFGTRDTEREPSKSGVIGVLAAAQGRGRHAPLDDLARLRMGVRVDREGTVEEDFHTSRDVRQADGKIKRMEVSLRQYLADAAFLVALEDADPGFLERLQHALRSPVWPLHLGRVSCTPSEPVWLPDGLSTGGSLEQRLATYPWLGREWQRRPKQLRCVSDVTDDGTRDVVEQRLDLPVGCFADRTFVARRVRTFWIPCPA